MHRHPLARPRPLALLLPSLHLPCKLDGGAYRRRLSSVEIRLDFVVSLETRWHTEAGRIASEQGLSFAQRNPNQQRGWVEKTSDQAIVDVPRRMRRSALAFDLLQGLHEHAHLVGGHVRTVRVASGGVPSETAHASAAMMCLEQRHVRMFAVREPQRDRVPTRVRVERR